MSNLPVLWVPPVTPPDPDERPPKQRGNRGVLVAAVAIVGLPLLAAAVHGSVWTPVETTDAVAATSSGTAPAAAEVEATPVALPKPAPFRVATGPSPETSGGNQPYIAAPSPPTAPKAPATPVAQPAPTSSAPTVAAPAPAAPPAPRTAVGPDGRPVRVIGIDRPSADMAQGEPPREVSERRTKDDASSAPTPATPAAAAAMPAPVAPTSEPAPAAVAAPIAPAAPRGSIDTPRAAAAPSVPNESDGPAVVKAEPEKPAVPGGAPEAPLAEKAAPVVDEPAPTKPSIVVAPAAPRAETPSVVRVGPPDPGPVVRAPPAQAVEAPAEAVPATPASPPPAKAEAMPRPVPLPPKRVARPAEPAAADPAGSGDFADRLAAIRRAESRRAAERRAVEPPPPAYEDDDEEVVVVPRRPWGWVPPFFGGERHGPALRSYEPPPRIVTERAVRGENCHYHAWPTEEMAFHRTVRCHWHRDPEDPSIRYVR